MTGHMRALLCRARQGDRAAEETLLRENSGLVYSLARRFYGRGAENEDVQQLAMLGFLKAVRGFDLSRGTEFSTYAVPKITGEIRRFLRDDGTVKVGRAVKERTAKLRRAQSAFAAREGREPTVREMAEQTGLTPEEVACCEMAAAGVDSLERELAGGGTLLDRVGEDGMEERACLHLSLERAMRELPARDRQVLLLRYRGDLTQQQVSRLVGVSQVQVSRIEKRAIAALRQALL